MPACRTVIAVAFTCVLAFTHTRPAHASTELLIGAAASLKDALETIRPLYEAQHKDVKISLNLAASSVIARQIKAKAPIDVFFSADDDNMDALSQAALIDKKSRRTIVGNELVLIMPQSSTAVIASLKDLASPRFKAIALCDSSVPVGGYARRWLEKAGMSTSLKGKIVKPDNVRAALALVASGSADAGFVYATDAAIDSTKIRIALRPLATDGIAVRFPAAVVAQTRDEVNARAFIEFLTSPAAQKIFRDLGFTPP